MTRLDFDPDLAPPPVAVPAEALAPDSPPLAASPAPPAPVPAFRPDPSSRRGRSPRGLCRPSRGLRLNLSFMYSKLLNCSCPFACFGSASLSRSSPFFPDSPSCSASIPCYGSASLLRIRSLFRIRQSSPSAANINFTFRIAATDIASVICPFSTIR